MSEETLPAPKPRKPSRKVRDAVGLLCDGKARNIADAARKVGLTREALSRACSAYPEYIKEKAARAVAVSSARAAGRLGELINRSRSEKVGLDASKFALQVAGIAPDGNNINVSVGLNIRAGWIIDLSGRSGEPHVITAAVDVPNVVEPAARADGAPIARPRAEPAGAWTDPAEIVRESTWIAPARPKPADASS
jgi:hypothetical protein